MTDSGQSQLHAAQQTYAFYAKTARYIQIRTNSVCLNITPKQFLVQ